MPAEIEIVELQIEWGLNDKDFEDLSFNKIQKVLEFRRARRIGEIRYKASQRQ